MDGCRTKETRSPAATIKSAFTKKKSAIDKANLIAEEPGKMQHLEQDQKHGH